MPSLKTIKDRIRNAVSLLERSEKHAEEIKINQGYILAALDEPKASKVLADHEFKIFSQWGEDGIIQYLVRSVDIKNRTFIEFGVEDFSESNCRFLMMKDNWKGFVIDGSEKNLNRLRSSSYFWKYQLDAVDAFITRENINELLARSGFDQDLGILSIDIDGNDYHVLEAITAFKPRILICEYNSVFGPTRKISTPYDPKFFRTAKHFSNLYFGASLAALTHLAQRLGYTLVGSNSAGVNAFYVRNDLMNDRLLSLTAGQAYVTSNARESRNPEGELTFVSQDARLALLKGLPVLNVETGEQELL